MIGINTNTHDAISYPFLHNKFNIHVHTKTYMTLIMNRNVTFELGQLCMPTQ